MSNWQSPPQGAGAYPFQPGQQGYPQQNPGYPPNPGFPPNPGYPQGDYNASYPPAPGFVPPGGNYGQGPPPPPPNNPQFDQPYPGMYGASYSEEAQNDIKGFEFNDQSIRRGFIRKVYSILMCQLLITGAMIALFMYHAPTRNYVRGHQSLFWIALVLTIVLLICMACCESVRRKAPMNFVFLFIFTGAEGFLLGVASSTYRKDEVLMAVGITAAICFALTIFAFQTKWDFTGMHAVLFVCLIVLLLFGIIAAIFHTKVMQLIYASLGALLFSFYLIYDTQMMMGGNHKYSISPEEYIFASLNLYLDIVNIFLYILSIIGSSRD